MTSQEISTSFSQIFQTIKNRSISFFLGMAIVLLIITVSIKFITMLYNTKNVKKGPPSISLERGLVHNVLKGEDLFSISRKYYGSGLYAMIIADFNKLPTTSTLSAGQKLIIPSITMVPEKGEISATSTAQVKIFSKTYVVQPGESLWDIAQKRYGDGNLWTRIAETNGITDPNVITEGYKLKLP
ncbi:MAG: LysM peptidoglycan-binding domain-containing protein [Candidatus Roizmanbacteria bacterium]